MSEFQYFEWIGIERRLDHQQLSEVERLSSHMDWVTPGGASVTYQWGSFKHDPIEVLARYFDGLLYTANWGTRLFALRFGPGQIDLDALAPYIISEGLDLQEVDHQIILSWASDAEGSGYLLEDEDEGDDDEDDDTAEAYDDDYGAGGWDEDPEGTLSQLAPIRDQILSGDYRAVYLGWLAIIDHVVTRSAKRLKEPPVPPGLATLNAPLHTLIELFGPRPELLAEAARESRRPNEQPPDWSAWLKKLSPTRRDDYLERLARNEPGLGAALQRELRQLAGIMPAAQPGTRTAADLLKTAAAKRKRAAEAAQAAAHARRIAELEALARRGERAWLDVITAIELKTAAGYDAATAQLRQLRELAEYQHQLPGFKARLDELLERYARRPALVSRLERLRG